MNSVIEKLINQFEGVYLLFKGKECVYVGESENVGSRIRQHISDPQKDFDDFRWFICHDRKNLEAALIKILRPKYNVVYNYSTLIKDFNQEKSCKDYIDNLLLETSFESRNKDLILFGELEQWFDFYDLSKAEIVEIMSRCHALVKEIDKNTFVFNKKVLLIHQETIQMHINEITKSQNAERVLKHFSANKEN